MRISRLFEAVLLLASVAGCDSGSTGGGSGGQSQETGSGTNEGGQPISEGSSSSSSASTGAGANGPCGSPKGAAVCSNGSPCDPSHDACLSVGLFCAEHELGTCAPIAEPRCVSRTNTMHCGDQPVACGCNGLLLAADCNSADGISFDASACDISGTFTCGEVACRNWLDVCVQTELDGTDGHCEPANRLGCDTYGLADCRCIDFPEGKTCGRCQFGECRIIDQPAGQP